MKFGASRSQLYDAQKTAHARRDAVTDVWSDAAAREFDERVWGPFDAGVTDVLRAVDALSAVFNQVRHDCQFGSE